MFATGLMFSIERFSVNEKGWRMQFHPEVIGAIRQRWVETDDACGALNSKGAQSGEEQETLRRLHKPRMQVWLDRFPGHWLEAPDGAVRETGE